MASTRVALTVGLAWLALVCGGLGCSQSQGLEAVETRATEGQWVSVGHPQELQGDASGGALPWGSRPRVSRLQPPAREPSVKAWRDAPSEEHALQLARAYFFELVGSPDPEVQRVPVNPESSLRVRLPATESGELEVATRGYVFRSRPLVASGGAEAKSVSGATFYGARHLWTAGGQGVEQEGLWLTQRAEEFVVTEGGAAPYRATYEVEVPEGIQALRDAGEYLEFLDGSEVPVVRLHYAVARDAAGRSRQGTVRLMGARPAGRGGPGNLPRLALERRTLKVRMEVGLEGLEGPVVVDPGWSATGSLAQARYRPSSTLLPNGKVLVAAGDREGGWGVQIASVELYDPATGTWSAAGTLANAREFHSATLLPDGRVLIAGGMTTGRGIIASTELYDWVSGTWSLGAPMGTARCAHSATLLNTGKVLVAGGGDCNGGTPFTTAELYDPATGTWSATGALVRGVNSHTATLLNSGKVLVAGGFTLTAVAQLYDPATGTWSATGSMARARTYHTATLLPNGKVLVAGGSVGTSYITTTASAELYDPATGTWSATAPLTRSHAFYSAVLLPNGKVLVGCGYSYEGSGGAYLVDPELYDPAAGTWIATSPMGENTDDYAMTLLADGSVLVAGGYSGPSARAELYSSATGTWSATGSLTTARSSHTTTLLPGGKVLVTGGQGASGLLSSVELYDPVAGTWNSTGAMGTARARHTATLLPGGKVLVTGGDGASGPLASAELYDPAAGTWSATAALATARTRHTATLLSGGRVLVTGGSGASGPLASAELYAPAAGGWLSTGSLATARSGHTATMLTTGKVLVAGGQGSSGALFSAELYDPAAGTFSAAGTLSIARADHTATVLPTGKVLLAGGSGSSGAVASAELYDPVAGTFSATGPLTAARTRHAALALPSGRVLVASGLGTTGRLASVEVYEPARGTFSAVGSLGAARADPSATVLSNGKALLVGGSAATSALASAEVYEELVTLDAWRPVVTPPASLQAGATLTINGTGLRGISESNGGTGENSATNFPLVSLMALEGGRRTPVALQGFSSTSVTIRVPPLLDGYYLMSVTTHAIPGFAVVFVDGPPAPPVVTSPTGFVSPLPTIAGTAEAGSTVTVFLDGAAVGTATADALGAWSFTLTSPLSQGPYTATATATDAGGATSAVSAPRTFTVDTMGPSVPVITAPAAFVNSVTPTIAGTSEAGSTVVVTLDGSVVGTVTANGSGAWSLVPTTPLAQGAHTVTAKATDTAGNTSASSAPYTFTVDTVAPPTPSITAPASAAVVTTTTPIISGTAEAGITVVVSLDGVQVGTATANGSGAWSFTPTSPLSQGSHSAIATARDAAGNSSSSSASRGFTVDTMAPTAPVITAPSAVVNTTLPVISGTAEVNSTVTVRLDGSTVGTVTASFSGSWNLTPPAPLSQGSHTVTATARDAAGNTSPSSSRSFTVDLVTGDNVAPAAPVLTAPAMSVNIAMPTIAGIAEAGSTVTVKLDGTVVGTVTASASGSFTFSVSSPLAQGAHTVTATARDAAGNTSVPSEVRSFTVDSVAPAVPMITEPGPLVTTPMPTISGTADPGGTVTVLLDGEVVGKVPVNSLGAWSFTPASPLMQRLYKATAIATDAAGNASTVSPPRGFVVDSVAPNAPEVLTPAAGSSVSPDELLFSGNSEPDSTVTVLVDGLEVGTTRADQSSTWSVGSVYSLADGQHVVTAVARDGAGNASAVSAPVSFTVEQRSCGCTSSPSGGAASLLGLLALWLWGRRGR